MESSGSTGQALDSCTQRELIADRTQAEDAPDRNVHEIGVTAEGFACLSVGQMYFDEREPHGKKRIPEGDARVRESARVENQKCNAGPGGFMNPGNQLVFRIALERCELVAGFPSQLCHTLLDGGQGGGAINFGLAAA